MTEREIVLVNGKPGSGKTWLAKELVDAHQGSAEYLSVGTLIREIGSLAVTSVYEQEIIAHLNGDHADALLDPEIVSGIMYEAAQKADGKDLLVVDDFPRDVAQMDALTDLTHDTDRIPLGVLQAVVPDDVALRRLMQRQDERALTPAQATRKITRYNRTSSGLRIALLERGFMIEDVDTNGPDDDRLISSLMAQAAIKNLRQLEQDLAA